MGYIIVTSKFKINEMQDTQSPPNGPYIRASSISKPWVFEWLNLSHKLNVKQMSVSSALKLTVLFIHNQDNID